MAAQRKPGRPDALNAAIAKTIVDAVRDGASIEDAAAHVGVSDRTVYRWLARGEDDQAPAKFRQFCQALTRARASAKVDAIAALRAAMPDDWRAALAYLERRYPEEWGRRTAHAVELAGKDGRPIETASADLDLKKLSDDELDALAGIYAKAHRDG